VTSSTNIANVNASGQENFTAANLASSCAASETAVSSGSTTITNGTLQTDNGDDDPTNTIPDHPPVNVTLPTSPAPNTSYDGHIHIGNTTDTFRYVFNEQIRNPDGSITVNAAHQYLLGPTAVGELIVGQSVCGVTATPNVAPVARANSYSVKEDAILRVPRLRGVLANDSDANGDRLTARKVTTTRHGTLTLRADGSLVYNSKRNFAGVDTFYYRAFDGKALSNKAKVTIRVRAQAN